MASQTVVKKAKNTPVTRQFLLDLANTIHSSKNRTFLRLCRGTLQNGPDPVDGKRTMHCGLGELYYAMTGRQPEQDHVTESKVITLAVERSPFGGKAQAARAKAEAGIKKLGLPKDLEQELLEKIEETDCDSGEHDDIQDPFVSEAEAKFRETLDDIPGENDSDGCQEGQCTAATYKERSKRVAAKLRQAARCLPA